VSPRSSGCDGGSGHFVAGEDHEPQVEDVALELRQRVDAILSDVLGRDLDPGDHHRPRHEIRDGWQPRLLRGGSLSDGLGKRRASRLRRKVTQRSS